MAMHIRRLTPYRVRWSQRFRRLQCLSVQHISTRRPTSPRPDNTRTPRRRLFPRLFRGPNRSFRSLLLIRSRAADLRSCRAGRRLEWPVGVASVRQWVDQWVRQ